MNIFGEGNSTIPREIASGKKYPFPKKKGLMGRSRYLYLHLQVLGLMGKYLPQGLEKQHNFIKLKNLK